MKNVGQLSLETARMILMGYSCAPLSQLSLSAVPPSVRLLRDMFRGGLPVYAGADGVLVTNAAQITTEEMPHLYVKGEDLERALKERSPPDTFSLLRLGSFLGRNGHADSALESRLVS